MPSFRDFNLLQTMGCFSPLILGFSHDARWLALADWTLAIISCFLWIVCICEENGNGGEDGKREREQANKRERKREWEETRKKFCVPSSFTARDVRMPEHVRRRYRSWRCRKASEAKRVNCKDGERKERQAMTTRRTESIRWACTRHHN